MGERKADLSLGPFINYPNRFNKICLIPTPRLTYGSEPRSKRDMEKGGVSACDSSDSSVDGDRGPGDIRRK